MRALSEDTFRRKRFVFIVLGLYLGGALTIISTVHIVGIVTSCRLLVRQGVRSKSIPAWVGFDLLAGVAFATSTAVYDSWSQ